MQNYNSIGLLVLKTNLLINLMLYHHHHHQQQQHHQCVLPKGRYFTTNAGTKIAFLFKGRSFTANSGTKVSVLLGISAVAYICFPHPILSSASEQIIKDLKRSQGPQREGEESGFG